jgi:hypothetical protein
MGMMKGMPRGTIAKFFQKLLTDDANLWTRKAEVQLTPDDIDRHFKRTVRRSRRRRKWKLTIPGAFIFGFRVYFGHLATISKFDCRVDWNQFVRDVVAETMGTVIET